MLEMEYGEDDDDAEVIDFQSILSDLAAENGQIGSFRWRSTKSQT